MKKSLFIGLIILIVSSQFCIGQHVIQSSCSVGSVNSEKEIEAFAYENALSEMRWSNHHYHDSILVPSSFVDSIRPFVGAYHNAMELSDSVVDYRAFTDYFATNYHEIRLVSDPTSDYFIQQNDSFIIVNDSLASYLDSLRLTVRSCEENVLCLTDTTSTLNMFGNFDFFYNISGIQQVEAVHLTIDVLINKVRSGEFKDGELEIVLSEVKDCETTICTQDWLYRVNNNCQIEIKDDLTKVDENVDQLDVQIYPNPFTKELYVASKEPIQQIRLIGIDGRTYLDSEDLDNNHLNTTSLEKGLYLLEIKIKDEMYYRKLMKK